ncbi:hypothetical protein [Microlunatus antarcticus]|uniref:ANTAR domain-containing protein n=1 Tax=Microlunatus antarcticus TaxID=53388 RepID=A0A7W5JUN9_9ACTN|nr:hypothetical protein [Microlunatus antarcticus]MBB3326655.1 hypothetical protein [Microlunatus antarcticus]
MTNLVDGSAAGVVVELSAQLVDQLALVALGDARDGDGLVSDLDALVTTLHGAVPSFLGLRLTLVHSGLPVQVTSLLPGWTDGAAVTSLRLALAPVSRAFEAGGALVLWSGVPGSLVDLAADLGYVVARGGNDAGSPAVELDRHLPPSGITSGVEGLDELATVQRAAGLLISAGHDPVAAHETLRVGAADHGSSTYEWAVRLLDEHRAARRRPESAGRSRPGPEGGDDHDV